MKISELPPAGAPAGTERLPVVQDGSTRAVTLAAAASANTVPCLDALRAFEGSHAGQAAITLGHSLGGDGGGGTFTWDASDTTSDDDGITIAPTGLTSGRWKRVISPHEPVHASWFGVTAGNADNTTALARFLTYLATATEPTGVLPRGTIQYRGPLTIMTSGLALRGAGGGKGLAEAATGTVLKNTTDSDGIRVGNDVTLIPGVQLTDLKLAGVGQAVSTQLGIRARRAPNLRLTRVTSVDYSTGAYLKYCWLSRVDDCDFSYNNVGIECFQQNNGVVITATRGYANTTYNARIHDSHGMSVTACSFEGNGVSQYGLYATDNEALDLSGGTYFEGNTVADLYWGSTGGLAAGSQGGRVSCCYFNGSDLGALGVQVGKATNLTLDRTNVLRGHTTASVQVDSIAVGTRVEDFKTFDATPLINNASSTVVAGTGIGARVYNSNAQAIPTGVLTAVFYNGVRYDTSGHWSGGANTRLTVKFDGVYDVGAHVRFIANATGRREVVLRLNGVTTIGSETKNATSAGGADFSVMTKIRLVAGDYVEALVYQNSGGDLNVTNSGWDSNHFWIQRQEI